MKRLLLSLVALCLFVSTGHATDWPTWSWQNAWNGGGSGSSDNLTFYAGLLDTDSILTPSRAASGTTGTFTRASAAYITDYQGQIRKVESGSVAVEGSRVVTNLLMYSEDLSNAAWNRADITITGTNQVNLNAVNHSLRQSITVSSGQSYRFTFSAKRGTATNLKYRVYDITNSANITAPTSYYSSTNDSTYTKLSFAFSVPTGCASVWVYPVSDSGSTGTVFITGVQLENVTAQQPLPGEYVKTTSAAASKCFATTNGNSVNGTTGVVTEGTGTALPTSYPEWQAEHQYAINDRIQVAGWWYYATNVGGPSGAVAPTWLTGSVRYTPITISDGSMVWTLGGRLLLGYVSEGASTNKTTAYGLIPSDTLGSELVTPYDFTAWTTTASVTDRTANTVTTSGDGGIYKGYLTAGKVYQITITASTTATSWELRNSSGTNANLIATASGTYTYVGLINNLYVKNVGAGVLTVTTLSVKEVTWAVGTKSFHNGTAFVNNITGLTLSGDTAAVLSIVTDQTEIEQAGLAGINPGYKVYKGSFPSTAAQRITIAGATGNTNAHSAKIYMRTTVGACILVHSYDGTSIASIPATTPYSGFTTINWTPKHATDSLQLYSYNPAEFFFLLPSLEESAFSSSLIPGTTGSTTTRAATSLSYPTGATIKTNKCTNYNVVPADSLGAELAVNGGFDSDTSWTKQTGWSIGSGVATATGAADKRLLYQAMSTSLGKKYQITFTITAITEGGFAPLLNGLDAGSDVYGTTRTTPGTYTEVLQRSIGNTNVSIATMGASTSGSIDNLSVKEVGWATGTKSYWTGAAFTQNITGLTLSGDQAAVLSIVDDTAALTAAGLLQYAATGKVYKLDNSAGTGVARVVASGITGNTNTHSLAGMLRGTGNASLMYAGTSDTPTALSATYIWSKNENKVPGGGDTWSVRTAAGGVVYFILNQLEESSVANPDPIITQGAVGYRSYGGTNLRGNDVTVGIEWASYTAQAPATQYTLLHSRTDANNNLAFYYAAGSVKSRKRILSVIYDTYITQTLDLTSHKSVLRLSSQIGSTLFTNNLTFTESNKGSVDLGTSFELGTQLNANHFQGYIRNLRIYFKPLSDFKCQRLTTSSLFHDYQYADNYYYPLEVAV